MNGFYVGVDNTQPNAVRLVGVLTEDLWEATPLFSVRYTGRCPFNRFWRTVQGDVLPDAVAATTLKHDPFGTIKWFEDRGVRVCRYQRYDLPWLDGFVEEDELLKLPRQYTRAYTLGLRIAYQQEVAWVIDLINWEITRLHTQMRDLERACHKLVAVAPCPF
jgi:hypothetical protein